MTLHIDNVQINIASEHLVIICILLWAIKPKIRRLLSKRK